MKKLAADFLEHFKVLRLKPNDIVVFRTQCFLKAAYREALIRELHKATKRQQAIIFLEGGVQIGILNTRDIGTMTNEEIREIKGVVK